MIIYLACSCNSNDLETLKRWSDEEERPLNVLVAYPDGHRRFMQARKELNIGKWMLDSGAFSAFNSGKVIDIDEYIKVCKDTDADDIVALDVIGDHVGSRRNTEYMWEQGVTQAIPTYHPGEPLDSTDWIVNSKTDKVAVGSGADIAKSVNKRGAGVAEWYIGQFFARVWPRRVHGFGVTSAKLLDMFPFHSSDSTSWIYRPGRFGSWKLSRDMISGRGAGVRLSARAQVDYRSQVRFYQRLEDYYSSVYAKQMEEIEQCKVSRA